MPIVTVGSLHPTYLLLAMAHRLEALRGAWFAVGICLAWGSGAAPGGWAWIPVGLLPLVALLPRTRGTRVALVLGFVLESCVFGLLWRTVPVRNDLEGRFEVRLARQVRQDRWIAEILHAPDPGLVGQMVRLRASRSEAPGRTLRGWATLRFPRPPMAPGGFDEERWAGSAGLVGALDSRNLVGLDPPVPTDGTPSLQLWRSRIREAVAGRLATLLDPAASSLWSATLLADASFLPRSVGTAFRRSGLTHMLTVSGFHIVVLGGACLALTSLLRLPVLPGAAGAILVVWSYVLFLAFPPSALRAAAAFTAALVARTRGRPPHAGNALALACGILLLLDPGAPFRMGIQLSVCATAALIWLAPALRAGIPSPVERVLPGILLQGLIASVAATLATAPVLAWHVGCVPWIGIPAGLVASAGFAGGFLATVTLLPLAFLPDVFSIASAGASEMCARLVLEITLRSGDWSAGWIECSRPFPGTLLLWAVGLTSLCLARRHPTVRRSLPLGFLGGATLWLWVGIASGTQEPRAVFLSVGQGDATVLIARDRSAWLIDAGPRGFGDPPRDAGEDVVIPALKALRVSRLEGIVVTHPDLDHWGGVASVARSYPPRFLVEPATRSPDSAAGWDSVRSRVLASTGARHVVMSAGQRIPWGQGALECLSPMRGLSVPDRNAGSLVLAVRERGWRLLLVGDAEAWTERRILSGGWPVRADLLKVGHHGSRNGSSEEFLAAVSPRWALLSAGKHNRYHHPHPEAVARIRHQGARILDTRQGTWMLEGDVEGEIQPRLVPGRWWSGPWERTDLSLAPPPWISNTLSGKSSKKR